MVLKENRSWFWDFIFGILTLGIYNLVVIHQFARDTNIACAEDGKKTMGLLVMILLTILTGGLFYIIWFCMMLYRWETYLERHNVTPNITVTGYLLWVILGYFIIIGPIVAIAKAYGNLNQVARLYNHTNR